MAKRRFWVLLEDERRLALNSLLPHAFYYAYDFEWNPPKLNCYCDEDNPITDEQAEMLKKAGFIVSSNYHWMLLLKESEWEWVGVKKSKFKNHGEEDNQ